MKTFRYDSAVIGGVVDLPVFRTQFGLDKMSPKQLEFVNSNIESTYQAGKHRQNLNYLLANVLTQIRVFFRFVIGFRRGGEIG